MKKTRQANFELLRIVAMVMVIMLHYLVKGAVAEDFVGSSTPVTYFAWLLEAFCLVAVNCYVLISGYFLVESEWKPGRVVSLLCQVLFYSLLIPLVLMVFGMIQVNSVGLYEWVGYAFPINTEHYWFATAYLLLYLFAPLLAAGIRQMDKRQLQIVTGLLLFFFSLVKSVVPIVFATDRFGYDFGWFLCLFVLAGYIRRFGIPWLEKRSHAVLLYVLASAATWVVSMVCRMYADRVTVLGSYADTPYTYNHIFCLIGAVSLFYVFKNSEIKAGKISEFICKFAPYTFGVYLLHEHILVRYLWLEWVHVDTVAGKWSFLPHMIGCVALVYIAGTLVDFVRAWLFSGGCERISKQIMKQIGRIYNRYQKYIENFIFPLILVVYPLLKINQGIDVSDTTYSLGNFQYFGSMEGTWMVATFLANAAGSLLMHLPFGNTLIGMYFYTALFQSAIAIIAYTVLRRKVPAPLVFLGEFIALGLCWCPSTILYNYLTYLLMTAGALLLYCGVLENGCAGGKAKQTSSEPIGGNRAGQVQPGNRHRQICLYVAAGLCLGVNVAVRMPNVVQMAFIVVVWYGAVRMPENAGTEREYVEVLTEYAGIETENTNAAWRQKWKRVLSDTLWCGLGYIVGFGIPFIAICIKYGVNAYPSMVRTMFAMTEKATDYKPASMVTGMFGDYITGLYWLIFAGVCIAVGWLLFKVQQRRFPEQSGVRILCRIGYAALLLVLLRFYWGKGMFSFRYYEYSSMYYPTVLLLLAAIAAGVYSLVRKEVCVQQKILAMIVLVQIFVTPLGSNNNLYPIMNNLFLVIPFVLWAGYGWLCTDDKKAGAGFAWKAPLVLLCLFVLVQSIGFHWNFVFQDGMQGESRTMCVTSPAKAAKVYTGQDNGEMLQELAEYAEAEGLAGREVILYGELPGLGYLLDMPSSLSTFWPDLDSYRMVEYRRDMALIEAKIKQDGAGAPVVILASPVAAYLSEDADAMNWFGVDQEALDGDEKLQMLDLFMKRYGYQEQFCNARYAVYVTEK